MSDTHEGAQRRLQRLERVLAGRKERLARSYARQQRQAIARGPVGQLQRYGYPVALALVATAVLPTALVFVARRPRLLLGAALNGLGLWKLRRKVDKARMRSESSR